LAGDAAHTVHPLAGQGLNLGLGDVALLAELLQAREFWRPVDDARLLRRYTRERQAATRAMVCGTDGLQWLFSQPNPLWAQLRNSGLNLVSQAQPLKLWLAKQAMNT
jgi:2-polyprenyl-6-methoxyphenol hydroxylase-like FAD-dependent oxidoreductase